jgi:hypothetical protein
VLAALPAADNAGHCAARHANAMPSMDDETSSQSHTQAMATSITRL